MPFIANHGKERTRANGRRRRRRRRNGLDGRVALIVLAGLATLWAIKAVRSTDILSDHRLDRSELRHYRLASASRVGFADKATRPDFPLLSSSPGMRPVYAYSVFPGGIYSDAELRSKLSADAVAAAHYQTLQLSPLRTVTAPAAFLAYVSYRKGPYIYWTRKPIRVAKGETLLTDGVEYVRARCGNRISVVPQTPTSASEPAGETSDPAEPWAWTPGPTPVLEATSITPPPKVSPPMDPPLTYRIRRPPVPPIGIPWFPLWRTDCVDVRGNCGGVPEIDGSSAAGALLLLSGGLVLIRGRRKK